MPPFHTDAKSNIIFHDQQSLYRSSVWDSAGSFRRRHSWWEGGRAKETAIIYQKYFQPIKGLGKFSNSDCCHGYAISMELGLNKTLPNHPLTDALVQSPFEKYGGHVNRYGRSGSYCNGLSIGRHIATHPYIQQSARNILQSTKFHI